MAEKNDMVTNINWGAVDLALAQLSLDSRKHNVRLPAASGRIVKDVQDIFFTGDSIPVVVPAQSGEIVKTGGGVNHQNLIQIKVICQHGDVQHHQAHLVQRGGEHDPPQYW